MKKIIIKSIYYLPFYLIIIILINFAFEKNISPVLIIVGALFASLIKVISNVFDYDFYNDISKKDYLESKHHFEIMYSLERWNYLKNIVKIDSHKLDIKTKTESLLEYSVSFNSFKIIMNSVLTIRNDKNKIFLDIKKTPISFLPDKAKNYKLLRKIINKTENIS